MTLPRRFAGRERRISGMALAVLMVLLVLTACESALLPPSPPADPGGQLPDGRGSDQALPPTATAVPVDRSVQGAVVDQTTGRPITAATVLIGEQPVAVDGDGAFGLSALLGEAAVEAWAPGYEPVRSMARPGARLTLTLRPLSIDGTIRDRDTGIAVAAAVVRAGGETAMADADGRFRLLRVGQGAALAVVADGYEPVTTTTTGPAADIALQPNRLRGVVLDARTRRPVAAARVEAADQTATAGTDGSFQVRTSAAQLDLTAWAPGYLTRTLPVRRTAGAEVRLMPLAIKSGYLTYYGVGSDQLRGNLVTLAERTELNAITVDVKGDRGWLAYRSEVPLVREVGAQQEVMMADPKAMLAELKAKGIYTIARIVVFKDNPLARARSAWAVRDARGGLWIDGEGLGWMDPFREEVWDYNVALAVEAARLGFDEIQFDYIRFPTDAGSATTLDRMVLSKPNTEANRVAAITGFLSRARQALAPLGVTLAVDVFGYVCWRDDDLGIGQNLEAIGDVVDVISPMVYPNLFWDGIPTEKGILYRNNAAAYPYEVVYETLKIAQDRLRRARARATLRPWLQYYNDYISGKHYGDAEIRLQKKAAYDNGILGWLFWDPTNEFGKGGFDAR